MVKSELNKDIVYPELKNLLDGDVNYDATLYGVNIKDHDITVALGKQQDKFLEKGIVYFPIYLVLENNKVMQIGIYEIKSSQLPTIFDEDEDVEIENLGEPLLFSFIDDDILKQSNPMEDEDEDEDEDEETHEETDEETDEETNIDEEADEKEKLVNLSNDDFDKKFEEVKEIKIKELPKQTRSQANEERTDVEKSHIWVQKYLSNMNYDIVDNEGGGDCLFAAIRDAFESAGKMISVKKLRQMLSKEVTEDVFLNYKALYDMFAGNLSMIDEELKEILEKNNKLKLKLPKLQDRGKQTKIVEEGKELKSRFVVLKEEKKKASEMLKEYKFMKNVETIDKFRDIIETCKFWGDTWAVSTLERVLNVKLILLSEEYYKDGDINNVLQCGQLNDKILQEKGVFNPDYYIVLSYDGSHYQLVSYRERELFTYEEIPYSIKELILNKCLERMSGPYSLIPEFVDDKFKTIDLKTEQDKDKDINMEQEDVHKDVSDPSIVFKFYSKSSDKKSPGEGSGEKIPKEKKSDYIELSKIKDWRKKLSNFWAAPFDLDGHQWKTVEHYYQGSKFKKNNPKFYYEFSLDSGSELSKKPEMAKAAGGKSGKFKGEKLRPDGVEADSDFFGNRQHQVMEEAQAAKFNQNSDLKQMLILTKDARLEHFRRAQPPEVFYSLMKIRKQLR